MNLLLLNQSDFLSSNVAELKSSDRRFKHIKAILKADKGATLKAGILNGKMGQAEVFESSDESYQLKFFPSEDPPSPLQVKLVMALPRPKALLRVVQNATTLGVKEIFFVNAYRVEKAFWSCEQIKPELINRAVLLGLEQAKDTQTPNIHFERRLKPFVEDKLSATSENTTKLVAHPTVEGRCPSVLKGAHTIVIGPEGGFIPYEVEMLLAQKFEAVSLGPRILRSETAMVTLLARLQ
jgi:16S rRNA (uracil1498-N3)-methyltransferase